jgi:hypothetical protein
MLLFLYFPLLKDGSIAYYANSVFSQIANNRLDQAIQTLLPLNLDEAG